MEVSTSEFSTHCLQFVEQVQTTHEEIVLLQRGKPVARLLPVEKTEVPALFGCLKGSITEVGDIMEPLAADWTALADEHGRS